MQWTQVEAMAVALVRALAHTGKPSYKYRVSMLDDSKQEPRYIDFG